MVSFYVYYRVVPTQAEFARGQIQRLHESLAQSTGVQGRLMTKRGEPHLWMEVYEAVRDASAFERTLAEAVGQLQLEQVLVTGSQRHVECFECA